jgi:hypothetical protein
MRIRGVPTVIIMARALKAEALNVHKLEYTDVELYE